MRLKTSSALIPARLPAGTLAQVEAARDAALAAGKIYPDTASGLAATAEGGYFSVPSGSAAESFILYREVGGAAVEVKRYPQPGDANETTRGLINTVAQTFAGLKTFVAGLALSAKLHVSNTAAYGDHGIQVSHYADGTGKGDGQTYGIDVKCYPDNSAAPTAGKGAKQGIVIHNYSDAAPAMQIDNTRSQSLLLLKNAHNDTLSAGTNGTGDFLDLWGYGASPYPAAPVRLGRLDQFLAFRSLDAARPFTFTTATTGDALRVSATAGGKALNVINSGAGVGVQVTQSGAGNAVAINQTGGAVALSIAAGAGTAGFWPLTVNSLNFGPSFSTSTDGGNSLTVNKNGTGAGTALQVTNRGTGKSLVVSNASGEVCSVAANGEVEIATVGAGIVLKSPDGTRYRLTVANDGTLTVAAA